MPGRLIAPLIWLIRWVLHKPMRNPSSTTARISGTCLTHWNRIPPARPSHCMQEQLTKKKEKTEMRFLQRLNDQQHTRASNNGDTGASDLLQRVRSEGEGLLAAG